MSKMFGRLLPVFAIALVACGRIGFSVGDTPFDAPHDGAAGDAQGDDATDAITPIRCGTTSALVDDFEGTFSIVRWGSAYADPAVTVNNMNGFARIGLASIATTNYGAYETERTYDLSDESVDVEVAGVPNPTTDAELLFSIKYEQTRLEFVISHGDIRLRAYVPAETLITPRTPFTIATYRFLRFREAAGTMFAETSSDGTTWAPFGQVADLFDPRFTRISLGAGTYQTETDPGQALFAGINVGRAVAPACPASAFYDAFDTGQLAPNWVRRFRTNMTTCDETGGLMVMTPTANLAASCQVATRRALDLTNGNTSVRPLFVTTDGNASTVFGIADSVENIAQMSKSGTRMIFEVILAQTMVHAAAVGAPTYDPTVHRQWRIRHDAATSTLFAETSTGSGTWTAFDQYTGPFPVSADYVFMEADSTVEPSPGSAQFDGVNFQ